MRKIMTSLGTYLIICTMFLLVNVLVAEAGCPLVSPPGTISVLADKRIYTVGEAFETRNIGIFVYGQRNRYKYYGHHDLDYWANGVHIYNGYRFKEVGKKTITLRHQNKSVNYEVRVVPSRFHGRVSEGYLLNDDLNLVYRQGYDRFDPYGVVVRIVFTNGRVEDFRYPEVEFFANGVKLRAGYLFKEVGEKKFVIRVGDYDLRDTLIVVP